MHIVYEQLPSQDSSVHRCTIMLKNRMQCPERASYKLISPQKQWPLLMCSHHFSVERSVGEDTGDTYEVVPLTTT